MTTNTFLVGVQEGRSLDVGVEQRPQLRKLATKHSGSFANHHWNTAEQQRKIPRLDGVMEWNDSEQAKIEEDIADFTCLRSSFQTQSWTSPWSDSGSRLCLKQAVKQKVSTKAAHDNLMLGASS